MVTVYDCFANNIDNNNNNKYNNITERRKAYFSSFVNTILNSDGTSRAHHCVHKCTYCATDSGRVFGQHQLHWMWYSSVIRKKIHLIHSLYNLDYNQPELGQVLCNWTPHTCNPGRTITTCVHCFQNAVVITRLYIQSHATIFIIIITYHFLCYAYDKDVARGWQDIAYIVTVKPWQVTCS